jgi:hypothetical protein
MALNINKIRGAMNRANLREMRSSLSLSYTANDPSITPDGSVTIADGSAPTDAEILEVLEEIINVLENAGLVV